jgi:hypothetical protein
MSSVQQKEQVAVTLPVEDNYAVQPIENEGIIPVDGPIIEVGESSSDPANSLSEAESSVVSEQPTLASPFHSPKPTIDEGASETSFEEGEITEIKLECSGDAKDEVVDTQEKAIQIEIKKDGDEPEAKNETSKSHPAITSSFVNPSEVTTVDEGLPAIVDGSIQVSEYTHETAQAAVTASTVNAKPTEDVIEAQEEHSTVTNVTQEVVPPVEAAALEGEDAVGESSNAVPASCSVPPHLRPKVQPVESGRYGLETSKVRYIMKSSAYKS